MSQQEKSTFTLKEDNPMQNAFNDLLKTAQRWADNPTYAQIVALGKDIANGATPSKADNIINDVLCLYADVTALGAIIPSDDVFYIVSAYAYYTDNSLITMTQLAQGLAMARANNTDYFDLSDDMPALDTTQRGYATRWVRDNHIRVYKDPRQLNPTYANRVLYGDAIEMLGQ
jgi:hypothetical protein